MYILLQTGLFVAYLIVLYTVALEKCFPKTNCDYIIPEYNKSTKYTTPASSVLAGRLNNRDRM